MKAAVKLVRQVRIILRPRTRVKDAWKFAQRQTIRLLDPMWVLVYNKVKQRVDTYPLRWRWRQWVLRIKAATLMFSHAQPQQPVGFVAAFLGYSPQVLAQILPTLIVLRRHGWAVVIMDSMGLPHQPCGIKAFDDLHGTHVQNRIYGELTNKWMVDWDARSIRGNGVELYTQIWERMAKRFMRYTFPPEVCQLPEISGFLKECLSESDQALTTAQKLHRIHCETGLPVRVLGKGHNFNIGGTYFQYIQQCGKGDDIHFIALGEWTQNYFEGGRARMAQAFCLEVLSRHPNMRVPFWPTRDKFEAWLTRYPDGEHIPARVRKWVEADRTRVVGPSQSTIDDRPLEAREALAHIKAHKAAGGRVYGLMGKIVYDLGVPRDDGPGHRDMADWATNTVQTLRDSDILILIKPHPSEARENYAGKPNEYFMDLIDQPLPDNVLVLGHHWFNHFELAGLLDLALVWTGTSIVELGVLGVPVLASSTWASHDFPIEVEVPANREDYQTRLLDRRARAVSHQHQLRCARLLEYIASPEFSFPMRHATFPYSNERTTGPRLSVLRSLVGIYSPQSGVVRAAHKLVEPHLLN